MPTEVNHITDTPIRRWSDSKLQFTGQLRIEQKGKPAGFWYAYGNEWYAFYYRPRFNKSNTACNTLYKYTVPIPSSAFTSNVLIADRTAIVRLSPANIKAFVKHYVDKAGIDKLIADPRKRFYELLEEDIKENAGHFEELLAQRNYTHRKMLRRIFSLAGDMTEEEWNNNNEDYVDENNENLENLSEEIEEENEEGGDEDENADDIYEQIDRLLDKAGGDAVVRQILDDIGGEAADLPFQWPVFWDTVRGEIGGVEFSAEFFNGKVDLRSLSINSIDLSWIALVELRSGVIFKPATFFKSLGICPTMTHVFCKKDRKRLKTRKGRARRELLKRLMTRKGVRFQAPACN
jgi:hypothetical protein